MNEAAGFGPRGWTPDRLPDLDGRVFVITGGNSGIGIEAARLLGGKRARVTILARSKEKGEAAVAHLRTVAPGGVFDYAPLLLNDLSSVRLAAKRLRENLAAIDGLIANAGIMMAPQRQMTADGFEMQFGVNHLGHFALAGLLFDLVEKAGGRFVSVSSIAHRFGALRFDDLMSGRAYSPTRAYAQSKLANLVFALELNRRLEQGGRRSRSYACHPGYSDTNLQFSGPSRFAALAFRPLNAMFAQPAAKGAVPTVLCAAGEEARPGGYYGPTGFYDMTGPVGAARTAPQARNQQDARRLWDVSEELTGVVWPI
ncbi:MAG: SDR family NAD(P)-dependent oxidoreductase [Alphaproteobacteria bacterium]|nr:SDR family NAD(P)-dependent oxidoreductase [Alphaproteobacteria bacterium]